MVTDLLPLSRGRISGASHAAVREYAKEARRELLLRDEDTRAICDRMEPHVRRLEMVAMEIGPSAMHSVAEISTGIRRLRRQSTTGPLEAA